MCCSTQQKQKSRVPAGDMTRMHLVEFSHDLPAHRSVWQNNLFTSIILFLSLWEAQIINGLLRKKEEQSDL